MREPKYHIYMNEEERNRVIQSLISLKNDLLAQGRYSQGSVHGGTLQVYFSGGENPLRYRLSKNYAAA